jgi:hypothetical protein
LKDGPDTSLVFLAGMSGVGGRERVLAEEELEADEEAEADEAEEVEVVEEEEEEEEEEEDDDDDDDDDDGVDPVKPANRLSEESPLATEFVRAYIVGLSVHVGCRFFKN